jgi:predicted acyl esterase
MPAVMTVGGWFDAEDLYGPLNTYSIIEKTVKIITLLLWGPWSHGD